MDSLVDRNTVSSYIWCDKSQSTSGSFSWGKQQHYYYYYYYYYYYIKHLISNINRSHCCIIDENSSRLFFLSTTCLTTGLRLNVLGSLLYAVICPRVGDAAWPTGWQTSNQADKAVDSIAHSPLRMLSELITYSPSYPGLHQLYMGALQAPSYRSRSNPSFLRLHRCGLI